MITFIEQSDVEEAATQATLTVNKEIAHYLKEASPDPSTTSNLMANSMRSTRNAFLLELLSHNLISDTCYRKLHDTREDLNE